MTPLDIIRILAALLAVLGMIGLFALAAKRIGLANSSFARAGARKRLQLVEVLPIDQKRRAAIIRWDDREHLVILNANSATVVERGAPALEPTETPSATAGNPFAALLNKALERRTPTKGDEAA